MGNITSSTKDELEGAVHRVESHIGSVSTYGRYHKLPKRLEDTYSIDPHDKPLGSGYNGAVLLARSRTSGGRFAVKNFKLLGLPREKRGELISEAEIFLEMDHPHVARLVDVFESEDRLSLVMECMDGGELFDRVHTRKVFSEKDAAEATWQMLLAVNYIHGLHVVHRDLKLENFLYERKDSDHLKLIDFGFSKIWDVNTKMELSCGTLSYVAPEVLEKSYTSQCDLWSLGVIVFILLAGYMPFHAGTEMAQIKAIRTGRYNWKPDRWAKVSSAGVTFVKQLLVVDPSERLTAEQALNDPWILNRHHAPHVDVDGALQSLVDFGHESKFRRACMKLMAWSLTAEERSQVREIFLELDQSKCGIISASDLKKVLEDHYHLPEDEMASVFQTFDHEDPNSHVHHVEIHYADFLAAMMTSRLRLHDELLKSTFSRFDTHNSGFIEPEDLKSILGPEFENSELDEILGEVDVNHDGKISLEEFIAYMSGSNASMMHTEAAHRLIDEELEKGCGDLNDDSPMSPVRLRKRDKFKLGLRLCASKLGFKTH